ncbi:MAG: hypothetical protein U0V74_13615 [Chitinophagales bacterium]
MNTKHLAGLAPIIMFTLILCACVKKNKFDSDAATSYSTADNLFKDVSKVIENAANENNLSGKTDGTQSLCATVTLNPNDFTTFPKTVTVDFGTLGCTDQYGVNRRGMVTAVFTDYLHNPGAHVQVTFQNYYVNSVKLEGTYNLANTSPNSNSRTFNDTITNGKATTPDGKYCTWNATRSSTQTGGFGTLAILDDEYTGQGQSTGIGFNGKNFNSHSDNVVWKLACRYLVSGTVTVYSNNDPKPVIIDFGNGGCDNKFHASYDIYNADLTFWY